jgi:predicted ester cyclase
MDRLMDEHVQYELQDDVDGVVSTLDAHVEHDVVGSPLGVLHTPEEARRFYEGLFADLDGETVRSERRYYGDGFLVDESTWSGTAPGTPLGIPGRGRALTFRMLHVFEFTDEGKIRRENVWLDYPAIIQQLSVSETDHPAPQEESRALVLRMYEQFDRGCLDVFDAIDPAFSATVVARAEPLDWEEFKAFGGAFLRAFPDGHHVFERVVVEDGVVMTLGAYEGTHLGEMQGIAPTGRHVSFPVMHLDRVVDGRIVEHRGLGDLTLLMEQLGATSS